mgnify:CR=1 FL=1
MNNMKKVVVASENPVKVNVSRRAFAAVFPNEKFDFIALPADSEVPSQPFADETRQGALNRLASVRSREPQADYWISQEGGLFRFENRLFNRAVIMVCDRSGFVAESTTASYFLPTAVQKLVEEGMELGAATDQFFASRNSGRGQGAVAILTDGIINREEYYLSAAVIALSELKHRDWYLT